MAFVNRSPRRTSNVVTATPNNLGPGAYSNGGPLSPTHGGYSASSSTFSKPLRVSYAPFSSSADRGMDSLDPALTMTPGPGSYQAQSKTQHDILVEKAGTLAATSLQSRVPRFHTAKIHQPTALETPGPGSYSNINVWGKKKDPIRKDTSPLRGSTSSPTNASDKNVIFQKITNIPSIPTQQQAYGYEPNSEGDLVLQKPHEAKGHTGVKADIPGPGEYEPKTDIITYRNKAFIDFAKSKSHRNIIPKDKLLAPGPGTYTPDLTIGEGTGGVTGAHAGGKRRSKASSFFVSSVPKTGKTAPVTSATPGPGTYAAPSSFSSSTSTAVPPQYQFFGSRTSRSVAELSASGPTPGPGTYYATSSSSVSSSPAALLLATDPYAPKIPFGSNQGRFKMNKEVVNIPGPGQYVPITNTAYELSKKIFSRNSSFGSTELRFSKNNLVSPAYAFTPGSISHLVGKQSEEEKDGGGGGGGGSLGPGQYDLSSHSSFTNKNKKPSPTFLSSSKRFDSSGRDKSNAHTRESKSADAATSSSTSSTSLSPSRPFHYDSFTNTYAPHVRKTSSMFAANVPRFFKLSTEQTASAALGPGQYNVSTVPVSKKNTITAASAFKSNDHRFSHIGSIAPGPGAYEGGKNQWVKRSFNITIATE